MKKFFISCIILLCVGTWPAQAAGSAAWVKRGNKAYKENKYAQALKDYNTAREVLPDSPLVNFNLGTAQFKLKDYDKAAQSFEKSLLADDKNLEAYGNYNLGNARYMSAQGKENTDLQGAVDLLEGAVGNYKRALEVMPKDADAKFNYEAAQKKLKELREKLKKQPSQKQQNEQDKQDRQENKQQEQNEAQQEKQRQQEEQKQKDQGAGREQKEDKAQPQEQKSGQTAGENKEMSKDEAKMLLEGYKQEERGMGKLNDEHKSEEEPVLKDW